MTLPNCLLLALHQRRLRARVPPELFQLLYWAFVRPERCLRRLCRAGSLHDLRHWHDTFGIHPANPFAVFCTVCERGHLSVAQWLHTMWGPAMARPLSGLVVRVFQGVCGKGFLAVATWLHHMFRLRAKDVHQSGALIDACYYGHLPVAQWLAETFEFTAAHVRAQGNWLMKIVCAKGYLAMAQWLYQTFDLTADDLRDVRDDTFLLSCMNGHLHAAQWIHRTVNFDATTSDAQLIKNALHYTIVKRHVAVVQWLVATFPQAIASFKLPDWARGQGHAAVGQ